MEPSESRVGFGKVRAMKITCNACGSNYAIADEKVSGRLVKVRCKSCGAAIVVDARVQAPTAGAAASSPSAPAPRESTAPAATDAAADTWSVNLSESDSRTIDGPEIVAAYGLGQLGDAYVWKDGMDDWVPLMAVPELAAAIEAASRPVTPAATPARAADASPLPGGPAGARAATAGAATRSAATRSRQAPDLFGGARAGRQRGGCAARSAARGGTSATRRCSQRELGALLARSAEGGRRRDDPGGGPGSRRAQGAGSRRNRRADAGSERRPLRARGPRPRCQPSIRTRTWP
jgi:predicted Zn finger-like uncharacterized protein